MCLNMLEYVLENGYERYVLTFSQILWHSCSIIDLLEFGSMASCSRSSGLFIHLGGTKLVMCNIRFRTFFLLTTILFSFTKSFKNKETCEFDALPSTYDLINLNHNIVLIYLSIYCIDIVLILY